jgi:pyruvate formate lyase activating enzyme
MRGDPMTVDEVCAVIEKDRIFYDKSGGGATFSGGEPLVQWEFLLAVLEKLRRAGIHTAVETTGYAPWETVKKIKERVDLFLYDLKILDDALHRKTVGVGNDLVRENLRRLASDGAEVIVRVPVIPGYTQDGENIRSIFSFVSSLGRIKTVHLLPYHGYGKSKYKSVGREYALEDAAPPDTDEMTALAARAGDFGLECVIGG